MCSTIFGVLAAISEEDPVACADVTTQLLAREKAPTWDERTAARFKDIEYNNPDLIGLDL